MTRPLENCSMLAAVLLTLTVAAHPGSARAEDDSAFARTTIDIGVVVSDVKKSVEFYTKALGFTEVTGFKVPGEFCKDAGLTNGAPLDIRVLVLGEGETATRLKLMQVAGVKSKKVDHRHIHSSLGFSYLTIVVKDTTAAVARAKKAGVRPIANGPVPLPKGLPQGVYLTIVRDPDGNLIELVGPKK